MLDSLAPFAHRSDRRRLTGPNIGSSPVIGVGAVVLCSDPSGAVIGSVLGWARNVWGRHD